MSTLDSSIDKEYFKSGKILGKLLLILLFISFTGCGIQKPITPDSELYNYGHKNKVIVFVPGLNGSSFETWTNLKTEQSFPNILRNIEEIDNEYAIALMNYPSYLFNINISLEELGTWFFHELKNVGVISDEGGYKEVIFIAHSLGNLVIRSTFYQYSDQLKNVKINLIISLASPSEGSKIADLGRLFMPNSKLLVDLSSDENNEYLNILNKAWDTHNGDTKIVCAYEKFEVENIGLIVSRESASRVCTERAYPVEADHISIAKPENKNSRIAKWVIKELLSLHENMQANSVKGIFKNAYYNDSIDNTKIKSEAIKRLIDIIKFMHKEDAIKFLLNYDFSLIGTIGCEDATRLFNYVKFKDKDPLFEKLNPFIDKPISEKCIKDLKNILTYSSYCRAMQILSNQ